MKKRILAFGVFGAMAATAFAFASILGHPPIAKEADADVASTLYVKIENVGWNSVETNTYSLFDDSDGIWTHHELTPVDLANHIYSLSLDTYAYTDSTYFKVVRGDGGVWHNWSERFQVDGYNYFVVNKKDGDDSWNNPTVSRGVYGAEDGTYLAGSFNGWCKHSGTLRMDASNRDGSTVMYHRATLAAGAQFKAFYISNQIVTGWSGNATDSNISSDDGTNYPVGRDGDNPKVTYAGTYNIFINTMDTYYFFMTPTTINAADAFGTYFLEHVGCDPNGVNVPSGWGLVSDYYDGLTDNAKYVVINETADEHGTDLQHAMATYDWAVTHNANLAGSQFISGRVVSGAKMIRPLTNNADNDYSSAMILAIAGGSVLATGGLLFLAKRRKRI